MKTILRRGVGVLLFSVLLVLSLTGVSRFLDKTDVDEKYSQFFAAETNFDVIFMGTSHTYNTILPQELWHRHGIASYNWGQSNCTVPIDYYVLQMLCGYTDPQLVVIDLYGLAEYADIGNGKYRTDARDQQRVQFDAFPLSRLKIRAVADIFDDYENRWDFLFPLAIYHNRWTEIRKDNFSPRDIPQKGAAFVLGILETDYTEPEDGTPYPLDFPGMDYLEKIIAFCREREIQMLFTYLPFVAEEGCADTAAAWEVWFRDKPDCRYLNMLQLGLVDYRTDVYTDASHLNYIGAAAVTDWLGGYLAEQYPFLVRQEDPAYAHWNADYTAYVAYKASRFRDGALYDNLQLLYGGDFHGTLTVSPDAAEALQNDSAAQNLLRRLGKSVTVAVNTESPASAFTVTDCRSGETVFHSTKTGIPGT